MKNVLSTPADQNISQSAVYLPRSVIDSDILEDIQDETTIEEERKIQNDYVYDIDNMAVDIEEDEELIGTPDIIEEESSSPPVADTLPVMRQSMELPPPDVKINKPVASK